MPKQLVILDNSGHYDNEEFLMDEADADRLAQMVADIEPFYLAGIAHSNPDFKKEIEDIKARAEKIRIRYVTNYE